MSLSTMKTSINPPVSRFSKFARVCLAISGLLITLAAAPRAVAAAPNGAYELIGGKGSLSSEGKTITIPKLVFQEIVGQGGAIVIRNNKLQLNRNLTGDFFKVFLQTVGTKITKIKSTGPTSITLVASGESFTGRTTQPIRTTLTGTDDEGDSFNVSLTINVSVTVSGDRITVTTRFSGGDENEQISGNITLRGKL